MGRPGWRTAAVRRSPVPHGEARLAARALRRSCDQCPPRGLAAHADGVDLSQLLKRNQAPGRSWPPVSISLDATESSLHERHVYTARTFAQLWALSDSVTLSNAPLHRVASCLEFRSHR